MIRFDIYICYGEQGWCSGDRERSPPTNVAQVRFPDLASYMYMYVG